MRIVLDGRPHVGVTQETEAERHDADDGHKIPVDPDRPPHDPRFATEVPLP